MDWKNYTFDTPTFTLNGLETQARVVDCYDSDTVTLVFPIFGQYFKFSCRIYGIDGCEVKGGNKALAQRAKNRLLQLCGLDLVLDSMYSRIAIRKLLDDTVILVDIKCREHDKYGRVLVDVWRNGVLLSNVLLEEKLVYKYEGGTKLTEEEQRQTLA